MHSAKLIWVTPDAERLIGKIARVSNPKNENNPNSFEDKKNNKFNTYKNLSDQNIQMLVQDTNKKFYEYEDYKKIVEQK